MRRTDFVHELQRIVAALKIQDLANFLSPFVSGNQAAISTDQKKTFAQLFLDSQVGYREITRDERAKEILDSLDVSRVYSASEILNLLAFFYNSQNVSQIAGHLPFRTFHDFLVRILAVTHTCARFLGENGPEGVPTEPAEATPRAILDLLVIDFDNIGTDADRLRELLATLDDLRIQLTILFKLPESRLRIRYIESGHDIRIRFEGLPEVIDGIRGFFSDIWTKIVNKKLDKLDRRNASIEGEFALIDKIEERVKNGTISRDDGERFKQTLLKDAFKLLESGTMLTETPTIEIVDNRKLLGEARATKLLEAGNPPEPEAQNDLKEEQ